MNIYEQYNIVQYSDFHPQPSNIIPVGKSKKKNTYYEDYIALDTETSHNHDIDKPIAWIYQWSFKYQNNIVYGRTPTQLVQSLRKIVEVNKANKNNHIMVYCHNLPYDWCYIQQYVIDEFGTDYKVLAVANHKLFSIAFNSGVTFRCTYKLSNKSLDKWSQDLGTKHRKLVGAIDYDTIRYQDTPLYKNDWFYMFYDVIVLDECIKLQLDNYKDTLLTIPLTSTSYVRREIKKEYIKNNRNFIDFQKARLDTHSYMFYREEFSGGITHGNRFFTGETVEGNIKHRDFVSHYPSCMRQKTYLYPVGHTFQYYTKDSGKNCTIQDILTKSKKYAFQCKIMIKDLCLKSSSITLPYAQSFKFHKHCSRGTNFLEDNGRLLKMTGTSIVYLNDIDLYWIDRQYNFDYVILEVLACKKGVLPSFLLDVVDTHFKGKSDFKNIEKELIHAQAPIEDIRNAHTDLMKSKNIVNGIYGCTATSYGDRDEYELSTDCNWSKKPVTEENIEKTLDKYYNSRNNCFRYEYGCYVTSYARDELMHFIADIIGYENYLYCDTDSCFYLSNDEIEKCIEDENKRLLELSELQGAYIVNNKGKKIYYNQFDLEDEEITHFRFLHAKCYAYNELVTNKDTGIKESVLKCIIAGVQAYNKETGKTREQELGNIDNLENGFIFRSTGGTRTIYTDTPKQTITINGHITEIGTGAIIEKVNKTLNDNFDKELMIAQDLENLTIC